jgi:cell division protein FtsQ
LKKKTAFSSRSRRQKRRFPSWRAGAMMSRVLSSRLARVALIAGAALLFSVLAWWAEYPQRMTAFARHSLVEATSKIGFSLSEVLVEGRHYASADKIRKVVGGQRGQPLLAYDPYVIKKQLEEIPWIRQAAVKRQLPNIISIQLTEREPVAKWQHRQKHYLVDEQGVIISSDHLQAFAKLPVIVGGDAPVHAPHILKMLEKFPDVRKQLTALVRVGGRRWDLHLDKKLQVMLPEIKIENALARLSLLIQQKKINPAEVSIIDLRIENQMAMRLSPLAAVRIKGKGKEA